MNEVRNVEVFDVGTKVPGTNYQLDPIRGAFNIGTIIRWLDFNDCFLAAECEQDINVKSTVDTETRNKCVLVEHWAHSQF